MQNWYRENIDYKTLGLVLLLLFIGIVSIYSATYDAGASAFFNRQLVWAAVGILVMLSVMLVPFRMLQLFSYPLYAVSVLILTGVLLIGKKIHLVIFAISRQHIFLIFQNLIMLRLKLNHIQRYFLHGFIGRILFLQIK